LAHIFQAINRNYNHRFIAAVKTSSDKKEKANYSSSSLFFVSQSQRRSVDESINLPRQIVVLFSFLLHSDGELPDLQKRKKHLLRRCFH